MVVVVLCPENEPQKMQHLTVLCYNWKRKKHNTGLVNKPTILSYWATENSTLTPFFVSSMSRTRYQQILRYFHLVDNSTLRDQDGYNKLGKIQPVLNLILPKFQETYCPSRNLSVDETLVKFKGKLSWKPAWFGLKLFTLADADNGNVLSYKVYTGKEKAAVACGLAKRIVSELAEPLVDEVYNIFMDNYYTSVMHSCSKITKTSVPKTYLFRSKC